MSGRTLRLSRMRRNGAVLTAGLMFAGLTAPAAVGDGRAAASTATTTSSQVKGSIETKASATAAPAGLKQVLYQGYTFDVPQSWTVVDESLHPTTCVRFDEHVLYLGGPGADQSCPSWLFGTTEAVLVQLGPKKAQPSSIENPISRQITVTAPRVSILATFDTDPNVIYTMLAKAQLPAPQVQLPNPAILDAAEGRPLPASTRVDLTSALVTGAHQAAASSAPPATTSPATTSPSTTGPSTASPSATSSGSAAPATGTPAPAAAAAKRVYVGVPALPANVANYHGLGFDACAAPSEEFMRAWKRHSPYGAIGIYIGGSDRACDQRDLTRRWVRKEARAAWRFVPMYAGPQASFGELKHPVRQGVQAAADAVVQARRLGFGSRTPIYYDMEAYPPKDTGVALRFLSAWTRGLHNLHYRSGVYSSSRSGVVDLARQYALHKYHMPDAIFDALWNGNRNVRDDSYGRHSWPFSHRLHQFSGNDTRTFGGDRMDIDEDYLDIALPSPGGTMQASPAIESSSVYYEGARHQLYRKSRSASGHWAAAVDMGGDLSSRPSAVAVGSSVQYVFYRGASGYLWMAERTSAGWQRARKITLMGDLGGAPRAVAQPNGVVDVFWKGSHDDHLWHGQYSPGPGWSGPQSLDGHLGSTPAPVENQYGEVEVFWKGSGSKHELVHVVRQLGSRWSQPSALGMGPLGGPPHAVAMRNGAFEVVWRGQTKPHHVWSAYLAPGQAAQGPRDLGGSAQGAPWPAAAQSTVRVFFRGTDNKVWEMTYRRSGRWHPPVKIPLGKIESAPFTAAGMGVGPFELFWTGVRGGLWAASGSGGSWSAPLSLGGHVG